jgi:hypothetical protein
MKFREPTKLHRKSGMGAPGFGGRDKSPGAFVPPFDWWRGWSLKAIRCRRELSLNDERFLGRARSRVGRHSA